MLESIRELRRRKNNQILFRRDSLCLQPLLEAIGEQDHRTVAAWALDCAWEPCRQLEERLVLQLRMISKGAYYWYRREQEKTAIIPGNVKDE